MNLYVSGVDMLAVEHQPKKELETQKTSIDPLFIILKSF